MIYFGMLVLWFAAIVSLFSATVASQRVKARVCWMSGFITATAIFDTLIVLTF